jgi:RNA-directed DNA polymerase
MKKKSVKNYGVFLGFDGEISMKARSRIIGEWRDMNFQRNSSLTLQDLAEMLNTKSRGIINYYGKMNMLAVSKLFRHLDLRLAKWVKNKFKSLKSSYKKANDWLRDIKLKYPTMFYHWQLNT